MGVPWLVPAFEAEGFGPPEFPISAWQCKGKESGLGIG